MSRKCLKVPKTDALSCVFSNRKVKLSTAMDVLRKLSIVALTDAQSADIYEVNNIDKSP